MKKILSVFLAAVLVFSLFVTASANENFLVKNAVIVVGANAKATDIFAAEKLEYYLEKITGTDIAVVTDDTAVQPNEIAVGETNRADVEFSYSENGSYVIRSTDSRLVIAGVGANGTIYGVYAFLEDYCGCRWYEKDIIKIPENAGLEVPAGLDVEYKPYFELTDTDTASARDIEFSLANAQNGIYRTFSPEQGENVRYLGLFCHTFSQYFCSPDKYFEEHPEYYALRGDTRSPNQLCLTNPDVFDIVYDEVIALLESQYDPDGGIQIVSLTQHDNYDYCECENCAAVDKENGSQSGTNLAFTNAMAERVKATGKYDNVVFDTFAYQYTRKAPTKIVPRDDVIIRLCSIECCFAHPLDDPDCPENVAFMKDLEEWGKICDRIYIWDYVHNYNESACIFPNFGVLQRNMQIFAENNVKGLYEEGNDYVAVCDAEFAEMRTYLLAQLMKDPYMDYYGEMDGYLEAVYGPGWKNIREYIDIITASAMNGDEHMNIWANAEDTLPGLKNREIRRCNELWENALEEAETREQREQIERSQLSWRYWKASNKKSEFSRLRTPYHWMTENDRLFDDMLRHGVTRFGIWGSAKGYSDCEMLHFIRTPKKWHTGYDEEIWDTLNPYFMTMYNFVHQIYNTFHFFG